MRVDRFSWFAVSAASAGLLLSFVGPAQAALPTDYDEGYIPHRVRIPKLPVVDAGTDLSASPWTQAAVLTGNLDWRRIRTAGLPVWTYLFYDEQALWLAYRSEVKPGPELKNEIRGRDQDLKKDDNVTIELDVGATGRVFYRFVINPAGALYDSVIIDKTWDSQATVKTATDARGWTAVIRIPFTDFGLSEPPVDTAWPFNVSTRAGTDNSWAPVLGGYHIPEKFALAVFGGEQARPLRMQEFDPITAGANSFRMQAVAPARCRLEAIDRHKQVVWRRQGPVPEDGLINYSLFDETVTHINFSFQDIDGTDLLSFWRPSEMPAIIGKLPTLRDKAAFITDALDRFPEESKPGLERMLSEFKTLIGTPTDSIWSDWSTLSEKLAALERSLTDAWLYAHTLEQLSPRAGFAVALATPMDKVMIKDFPCPGHAADRYQLSLARNEDEAMQVVVIPAGGALKQVQVSASPPVGKEGQTFGGQITTALVGHVETRPAGSYLPDYVGWYPDPILHFQQSCDVNQGEHVAFWVNVATDKNTQPGDYASTLTISAADREPLHVRLEIRVWDITLPDGTHLRNAFTYHQGYTRQLYGESWSDELARRYHEFILDHRLNIDSLYGKEERDVDLLRHGAERGMNAFNLFYAGRGIDPERARTLLNERMPKLQQAGIAHLAYLYGFDEVNDEVFPRIREVFGLSHQLYPDLPTMTTGYDNTFGRTTGLRDYVDIWVPLIPEYDMVEAERLREEGKEMWWYLCVGPRHPYPNFFVESPTIEPRLLMGAMSYKYQAGGVLYFMTNLWKLNDRPITSGPYTDWFPGIGKSRDGVYANGDGSLFCAGPDGPVTTLRYENIRDGLEDYEYLYELARVVQAVEARPLSLEQAAYLQHARELLGVPQSVVESSSRYTFDARELYRFREDLARAILKGRELAR